MGWEEEESQMINLQVQNEKKVLQDEKKVRNLVVYTGAGEQSSSSR